MKKLAFALVGASTLALAACAGEADEAEMVDDTTLVDESYDENADSLEDVTEEPVALEEEAAEEPAAPTVEQIDESDVEGNEAETEDVVGL